MRARVIRVASLLVLSGAAAVALAGSKEPTEVLLCDGETKVPLAADAPKTPEQGQKIADELMRKWKAKNPNVDWEAEELSHHTIEPPADNGALVGNAQGATYGEITKRDVLNWKIESQRFAVAGSKVFHSGDELGSTIAVSCDMCHPDAANTHPETYPKFQVQLGRVVLLRDMINWCLEHPVRAQPLAADDPRMRALEGYIYAQRKGVPLDYGKR